jgi:cytochrome c biogenesis protein CcmG/thiol:disulfide interchange protein DsbE
VTRHTITTWTAAVTACCLVLAACGGDDSDAGAAGPDDSSAVETLPPPSSGGDGPNATIDPNLPEEVVDMIGPVEVVGDRLPALPRDGAAGDEAVGLAAPVIVGVDYDGSTVRIDPATEGPTMVVFLAHWCPHCNAEIPRLNELRDEERFPEGLNIVAVSTAINPGQPNYPPDEWLVEKDWTYPVIADGFDLDAGVFIAADAYGVNGFPFVTLVDGDGVVTQRWSGEREPDEVIETIESSLGL